MTADASGSSPFPPIAEYGFLSDCETCAWWRRAATSSGSACRASTPRACSARSSTATPACSASARPTSRCPPTAAICRARWCSRRAGARRGGWIIVRDVLLIGPWHHENDRSDTHRRSPTDYDADHVLLRCVRCVNGEVQVLLDCEPSFDYGQIQARTGSTRAPATTRRAPPARAPTSTSTSPPTCSDRLRGPARHRPHADEGGRHALRRAVLVRARAAAQPTRTPTTASSGRRTTGSTGSTTASFPTTPGAPTSSAARSRSRACPTRPPAPWSPPPPPRCRRPRAASATGTTATPGSATPPSCSGASTRSASTGRPTTSSTSSPTSPRRSRASSRSCTASAARRELPEETLDHLSGYEGARPVRIGNGAYDQDQHDVWGAILDSFYLHTKSRDHLPERIWPILVKQVETALENWREPDRGIWEVRGEPQHFTSSKLMCWVAADRGARLAEIREELEYAARWQSAADEIQADICENALDERGVFTQHYDTDALDASVLLMPLVRFLPPEDERIRKTVLAIADELTERRPRAALPGRGDRRRARPARRAPSRSARSGWSPRWSRSASSSGPASCARSCSPTPARSASTPRRSTPRTGPPPRQLPAGLHPPGPDQRRDARDPRRPGARDGQLPARPRARPPAEPDLAVNVHSGAL